MDETKRGMVILSPSVAKIYERVLEASEYLETIGERRLRGNLIEVAAMAANGNPKKAKGAVLAILAMGLVQPIAYSEVAGAVLVVPHPEKVIDVQDCLYRVVHVPYRIEKEVKLMSVSLAERVLAVLRKLTPDKEGWIKQSNKELVALTGLTRSQIKTGLASLHRNGKLERQGHTKAIRYKIKWPIEATPVSQPAKQPAVDEDRALHLLERLEAMPTDSEGWILVQGGIYRSLEPEFSMHETRQLVTYLLQEGLLERAGPARGGSDVHFRVAKVRAEVKPEFKGPAVTAAALESSDAELMARLVARMDSIASRLVELEAERRMLEIEKDEIEGAREALEAAEAARARARQLVNL